MIEKRQYVVACFITTKLRWKEEEDLIVEPSKDNGLKEKSLVRLSKIATFDKGLIMGKLGNLNIQNKKDLDKKLLEMLKIYI